MLDLIRQTCRWGQGRFDGWLIPKAIYRRYDGREPFSYQTQCLDRRSRHVTLQTMAYSALGDTVQCLEVTLIDAGPGEGTLYSSMDETSSGRPCLIFTRKGLSRYLQDSGDTNPIHRGDPALVPGLWIFQCLHKRMPHAMYSLESEIRFIRPVYTGQHICLSQEQDAITGTRGTVTCFHMTIK